MKKRLFQKLIILLFALPALACGLISGDPTPTPAPASTPAPPDTPAPTEPPPTEPPPSPTPEPSPTADVTAGFVTAESPEAGITVQHPPDWAVQDLFLLLLATDEEIFDSPGTIEEGAIMVLAADDTESLGGTDPVELVNNSFEEFEMSADAVIVDGPNPVVIQGQDAALAQIEATSDDTGTPLVGLVVVVVNGDRAVVGLGITPQETETEYLPVMEAMMNTIVVSEPAETEPDITAEPPIIGETIPLAVGDSLDGTLAEGEPQDYLFTGQAGSPVTILVEPVGDDLDLVLEIFDADLNSLMRVDEEFTGDAEQAVFAPPADSDYFIRVEDFFGDPGEFEISVMAGGVEAPTDLTRLEPGQLVQGRLDGDSFSYLFAGTAGQPATIFLLPDEDLDATLTILGTDSVTLAEEVDDGFSGEAEAISFTPDTDGDYIVLVDAFSLAEGGYSIFMIDPAVSYSAEGTVPDGDSQNYRVCVPANASLVVFVDPAEEFDAVVNIHGPGGGTLMDQTDNGFSGEPEAVIFTEGSSFDTEYPAIVAVGGFGSQAGDFSIIISSTSSEPVVPDGC